MTQKIFKAVAWLQLACSLFLAAAVIWAYTEYRPITGEFLRATSAAILSTSKVVTLTAETIHGNEMLLEDTQKLLKSTRTLIQEFRTSATSNAALVPQYAEGMRSVANLLGNAGHSFSSIGEGLMFSVPTRIEMDGIRPSLVMSRPLENQATTLKRSAMDLKTSATSIQALATTIEKDGQNLLKATVETSNQAIKIMEDSEGVLKQLRSQALPNAVDELKATSGQLASISSNIDLAEKVPLALLIIGLILSGWCFLNSLSVLHLQSMQSNR